MNKEHLLWDSVVCLHLICLLKAGARTKIIFGDGFSGYGGPNQLRKSKGVEFWLLKHLSKCKISQNQAFVTN